ncbi:MAG: hypothetical protein Q8O30_07235 [Candidatus Omnitrophota bacterium]|nr:hypothetical protein [Candidatus Omnitrophota bacterium]
MKLKVIKLRGAILGKLGNYLTISELEGRGDITEEVKDRMLRDRDNADKVEERLYKNTQDEIASINREEQEELKNTNYNADEYADYLFQAEKMYAIETELAEKGLYPEGVYNEQKESQTDNEAFHSSSG